MAEFSRNLHGQNMTDKQRAATEKLIDSGTEIFRIDDAIEDFKKKFPKIFIESGDEEHDKDELKYYIPLIPYALSIYCIMEFIKDEKDEDTQKSFRQNFIDVFDGKYLWSRVKGLPQFKEIKDDKIGGVMFEAWANIILSEAIDAAEKQKPKTKRTLKDIPALIAKRPDKYVSSTDKISKAIFGTAKDIENSAFYEPEGRNVRIGSIFKLENGVKKEFPVTTAVTLKLDEKNNNIKFSSDTMLDPFCRSVHDAIVTLKAAGNNDMTIDMIYRVLKGGIKKGERDSPSEEMREKIREAIKLLFGTVATIDASQETKYYGRIEFQFEGHLLPVKFLRAKVTGVEVECIRLLDEPPLYTYAKRSNQINSCDIKLLRMPISSTEENIIIRNYLLEQILDMKNEKNHRNNVMLYDTLFRYLGLEDAPKQKKAEVRKKVHAILDNWVKEGFIKGYQDIKEGKSVTKVKITY